MFFLDVEEVACGGLDWNGLEWIGMDWRYLRGFFFEMDGQMHLCRGDL